MSKIKHIFIILLIIMIITSISTMTYASSVKVTEDNLRTSLQNFVASDENDKNYQISVEGNELKVKSDDGNYTIHYDLTNKPIFTYEANIKQGMSYKEFQDEIGGFSSAIVGYVGVANVQGVSFEDSIAYFGMSILKFGLMGLASSNNTESPYYVYDDTEEGIDVILPSNYDKNKIIYASNFGNRVMEYVDFMYKVDKSLDDKKQFNTFELKSEMKDKTETSCKIVTTLTVNTDSDFSKLNGYNEQLTESILDKSITPENADYLIKLKVGQKCKFESNIPISGYSISGSGYEFNGDRYEITATGAGKANGYLMFYVDGEEIHKTIYIIVGKNTNNEKLETKTININVDKSSNKTNNENLSDSSNNKNDERPSTVKPTNNVEKLSETSSATKNTNQEKTSGNTNVSKNTNQEKTSGNTKNSNNVVNSSDAKNDNSQANQILPKARY